MFLHPFIISRKTSGFDEDEATEELESDTESKENVEFEQNSGKKYFIKYYQWT
jgi:hypothetical protein